MLTRRQFHKMSALGLLGISSPGRLTSKLIQGEKLKIGQIGTTHSHAEKKLETVKKLKDMYQFVGIVEENAHNRREAETKSIYQDVNWLTEAELLGTEDLDAVLIETDLNELVPAALRSVEAGLHVHIDKPPGKSYTEFKELLDTAQEKNLIIQMGYMFRYNPAFLFCLEAVKKGWLGEIFEVDGVISKFVKVDRRQKLARTFGGGMMLLGCHLIDILIALLGKPDSVESYRQRSIYKSDGLYDNELVVFKNKNTISTIRSSLVEVEGPQRRQFVVCGTKGTIEIKPLEPPHCSLALKTAFGKYIEGYQTINLVKMAGRYDNQLLDFASMVRGEKKPDFTMNHDLLVHRTLLEACEIY